MKGLENIQIIILKQVCNSENYLATLPEIHNNSSE
jgi:hypothetical protein